jgi:D-lyxose ketol-isomerase
MKRSEVDQAIEHAIGFFQAMSFSLPDYAYWSPADWLSNRTEMAEVLDLGLGWDVTDFGSGNLKSVGRTIFTLRNGRGNLEYPKTYAQKVMYLPEGQKSIVHHHRSKMEDIFNQGGGNILVALWPVASGGGPSSGKLELSVSGRKTQVMDGGPIRLAPGNWVCIPPYTYHQFWAEEGHGAVLSTEISSVCNDFADNIFWPAGVRFPPIDEDTPARYVLCHEYENATSRPYNQSGQ